MTLTLISWTLEDYKMEKHHFYLYIDSAVSLEAVSAFAKLQASFTSCCYLQSTIDKAYEQRKTIETL